jgi:hypothetical protein
MVKRKSAALPTRRKSKRISMRIWLRDGHALQILAGRTPPGRRELQ